MFKVKKEAMFKFLGSLFTVCKYESMQVSMWEGRDMKGVFFPDDCYLFC